MNLNMLYSNFINWYKKLAQGSYGAIIDPDGEYYEVTKYQGHINKLIEIKDRKDFINLFICP